jgi:nucleoside-diphosphate-sugar epimerase
VHGIFHTASPINFSLYTTYETFVIPAVKGSEALLSSAMKAGSQLTSVVVTSSVAAVVGANEDPEHTFTEEDFATSSLDLATKDLETGAKTPVGVLYGASKTAADRAVWQFRKDYKPSFAISTINPAVVIGPPVLLPASGDKLNETLKPIFGIFSGLAPTIPPNIGTGSFVDVRDVAFMHIWAYEHASQADGQRYIACQGFGPMQAISDILRYRYKGTPTGDRIVVGSPGEKYVGYERETGRVGAIAFPPGVYRVSGKRAEQVMGLKYKEFSESVIDTAKSLEMLL